MLTGSKARKSDVTAQAVLKSVFGNDDNSQYELSIYVPSTIGNTHIAANCHAVLVNATRSALSKTFGGTTSVKGYGTDENTTGENVTVVSSIISVDASEEFLKKLTYARDYAYHLGVVTQQVTMLVTVKPIRAYFLSIE